MTKWGIVTKRMKWTKTVWKGGAQKAAQIKRKISRSCSIWNLFPILNASPIYSDDAWRRCLRDGGAGEIGCLAGCSWSGGDCEKFWKMISIATRHSLFGVVARKRSCFCAIFTPAIVWEEAPAICQRNEAERDGKGPFFTDSENIWSLTITRFKSYSHCTLLLINNVVSVQYAS